MTTDSDHVSNQAVLKGALDVLKENRHRGAWLTWREIFVLLAHIDAEPARLAAAREEQRGACADWLGETLVGNEWVSAWETAEQVVRDTPLAETPLADRVAELETRAGEWADAQRVFLAAEARLVEIREALGLREPGQEEVPAINLLKVKLSSAVDVVRSLVASATPNPADHPAMSLAWSAARAFLAITKVKP